MKVVLDFGPIGSGAKFKLRRLAALFLVFFAVAVLSCWAISWLLHTRDGTLVPFGLLFFLTALGGTMGGALTFTAFADVFLKDAGNQGYR